MVYILLLNLSDPAFQTLFLCSDLKPDEDVLVHAGASGVGLAAIQLARFHGA
jgi:NADPH:quinone reductase-like Zn-dependent oxidoreductase